MKQKLSQWAKEHNYTYQGAYLAFKGGRIAGAYKTSMGSIFVETPELEKLKIETITYSRVSNPEQKENLKNQTKRLQEFCSANGWTINKSIEDIGSGLNDKRSGLEKILKQKTPIRLVVEHKDRLTRLGTNYIKLHLESLNGELIIINEVTDRENEIMEDFVSLITSFCAKIYGHRRSKRKTEKIIKELNDQTFI